MDIKIAGAGLIGRLLGWHFMRLQHNVTLYEKDRQGSSSSAAFVAASMLAPQSERPESDEAIWNLSQESLKIWPEWLDQLNVPYGLTGSIVVAHPGDEGLLHKLESSLCRFEVPDFRWLDRDAISSLEPELSPRFRRGIYLKQEGWLDNRSLLKSLESRCGSICYDTPVEPTELSADLVVDCRGTGSDDPEIRGVRGELIRLHAPEVNLTRPVRLLHPKYRLYVAPRSDRQYVIGATQLESDFEGHVTVRSALELLTAAYTIHGGFEEAEIVELGSALRPAYPDNVPRIQWRGNVLSVNGLYRHGYLIAPAIVNAVAAEVGCR